MVQPPASSAGQGPLTAPKYRLTASMVAFEAGAKDSPSWPISTVVTPWRSAAS